MSPVLLGQLGGTRFMSAFSTRGPGSGRVFGKLARIFHQSNDLSLATEEAGKEINLKV
jgi:hypothetical protein